MHIIFQFDVRVVALFVGMSFFIQATAIGAQAYMIRELKQYRGVYAALLANLSLTVCLLLRLFADWLPDFLIFIVSNILLLTGLVLFYVALSQFTGFSYSKPLLIVVIVVVLAALLYFRYGQDDLGKRVIALSLGCMLVDGMLIHQLWRTQKTPLRFSANLLLVAFLFYGLSLVVRTISTILNPPQETSSLNLVQSATYLLSFALSFFWSMGFILMVSQRLRNDLLEVATIDVLTRIPNRRATQAFLEKELSRAQRSQTEFTVLLMDIDNFKKVNDRWGHAIGDSVLVKTASLFQSMIRKQDLIGRWGGEEFLMIVPGLCDASGLAERVRSEIANATYNHATAPFHITISIGVVCAKPSDEIEQILKKADAALYRSKRTKNTVSIAEK
jgi:diguanylate cyclase (GGDEF)-like protein